VLRKVNWSAVRRGFLCVWLPFHCVAVVGWMLPVRSAVGQSIRAVAAPYLYLTGTAQWWDLFAPNPTSLDVEVLARMTYADGTTKDWWFPRVHTLGVVAGYREDRWRKFIENVHARPQFWPGLARYAVAVNRGPGPVRVELVRYWRLVPDIGEQPKKWNSYRFWEGVE
jgi:hypothetical protein